MLGLLGWCYGQTLLFKIYYGPTRSFWVRNCYSYETASMKKLLPSVGESQYPAKQKVAGKNFVKLLRKNSIARWGLRKDQLSPGHGGKTKLGI